MNECEFLVVYDYGMGGVWGLAKAQSEAEIHQLLPQLQVVRERPKWLNDERLKRIKLNSSFVVGDGSTYPDWVKAMIDETPPTAR